MSNFNAHSVYFINICISDNPDNIEKEMSHLMGKPTAYAKTKTQISFAVNAKLISAFVFATRIVQFLFYLKGGFGSPGELKMTDRIHDINQG